MAEHYMIVRERTEGTVYEKRVPYEAPAWPVRDRIIVNAAGGGLIAAPTARKGDARFPYAFLADQLHATRMSQGEATAYIAKHLLDRCTILPG